MKEGSTVLGKYRYDRLFRRISKESTEGSTWTTRHYYYSDQWQVLEERVQSAPTVPERHFVWGRRYADDLTFRDVNPSSSTPDRLYATHDQWHVTSNIDRTGAVQERCAYTGYGESVVLTPAFGARANSLFGWELRYGAYRFDQESKLYQVRYRYLHSGLGRWLQRDRLQEAELLSEGANRFVYVGNSPADAVDPIGLWEVKGSLSIKGLAVELTFGSDRGSGSKFFGIGIGRGLGSSFSIDPLASDPYRVSHGPEEEQSDAVVKTGGGCTMYNGVDLVGQGYVGGIGGGDFRGAAGFAANPSKGDFEAKVSGEVGVGVKGGGGVDVGGEAGWNNKTGGFFGPKGSVSAGASSINRRYGFGYRVQGLRTYGFSW